MRLKPSRSATPSISHPGPKVYECLSPDDSDMTFVCESCGNEFVYLSYAGQFDHPGGDRRCEECKESQGYFIGRRWIPGKKS